MGRHGQESLVKSFRAHPHVNACVWTETRVTVITSEVERGQREAVNVVAESVYETETHRPHITV